MLILPVVITIGIGDFFSPSNHLLSTGDLSSNSSNYINSSNVKREIKKGKLKVENQKIFPTLRVKIYFIFLN